jgi:hypothetical protein
MAAERPRFELIAPSASAEQAAAIAAAIERFRRATAPPAAPPAAPVDPWLEAAILEGVSREHLEDSSDHWINT